MNTETINAVSGLAIAVVVVATPVVLFVNDLYAEARAYQEQLTSLEASFRLLENNVDAKFAAFDGRLDALTEEFDAVRRSNEDLASQMEALLEFLQGWGQQGTASE